MRVMKELNDLDDKKPRERFSPRNITYVISEYGIVLGNLKRNK